MKTKPATYAIHGAYYLTLVAYLAASYFPASRIWGFNWWAYYPDWVRWTLFGVGALAPLAARFCFLLTDRRPGKNIEPTQNNGKYLAFTVVLTATFGGLFYILRSRAHFLGDGYQLLSRLAEGAPNLKMWDLGSSLTNNLVYSLLNGSPDIRALHTYQIIAIVSGLLLVAGVARMASILFEKNTERMLFTLGLSSSGYMLLYFGYVENYALFVLSVLTFTLTGLLVAQENVSRYWLLPPLLAAMFFHVLGVTLMPSALYLLISPTRFGRTIRAWKPSTKLVALLPVVVGAALVFHHFYATSYFFRFAFVPLFENRFTVEGYTLFSMNHLLDLANLLFLLAPGLLIVIVSLYGRPVRRYLTQRPFIYLAILVSSVLGAAFIFDPKLGMPRDWDLFSLVGPPLAVTMYYLVIRTRRTSMDYRQVCVLSIVLGALILFPRAGSLAYPDIGVRHYESYLRLDKLRSRAGYTFLIKYYNDNGDRVNAELARSYWDQHYPQRGLLNRCQQEYSAGDAEAAFRLCSKAIEIDPVFYIPYFQLGSMYLDQKQPDSALAMFNIARGLNPYGADIALGQAMAYAQTGDMHRAEEAWVTVTEWTDEFIDAHLFLMDLYKARGDLQKYHNHLLVAGVRDDAPARVIQELGDYYLARSNFAQAADAYRRAIEKGADSAYVRRLMEQHPALRQLMQ